VVAGDDPGEGGLVAGPRIVQKRRPQFRLQFSRARHHGLQMPPPPEGVAARFRVSRDGSIAPRRSVCPLAQSGRLGRWHLLALTLSALATHPGIGASSPPDHAACPTIGGREALHHLSYGRSRCVDDP